MGKLLLLFVTITGLASHAQTITQESLQGKWVVLYIEYRGMTVDLMAKTYTISPELTEEFGEEYMAVVEDNMKQMLTDGFESTILFDGNSVTLIHGKPGEALSATGTYEIKSGPPVMLAYNFVKEGATPEFEAEFKDGNLLLKGAKNDVLIYKKV